MERITSFSVDHTKLTKGVYVSRIDGELTTFDIRMTTPNLEPALDPRGAHTIEHIGATLLRNGENKDKFWTNGMYDRFLFNYKRIRFGSSNQNCT